MPHTRSLLTPFLTFSFTLVTASAAMAQHSHGSGATQGHAPMQGSQSQMMANDQMMRSIDNMMTNIGTMMRDLAAMPMAGQHEGMTASMGSMLEQMRGVHGNLTTMMNDPQLMQNRDAMKAFNQACRDLEKMASALQSMTRNVSQAMKGLHHAQN